MKKAIIVASFGTTHKDTRKKCIESVVNLIRKDFPDFEVVEAITSRIVKKRIEQREGISIFNEKEAKNYLIENGFNEIYIQPLHILPGLEYEKLRALNLPIGNPLLFDSASVKELAEVLKAEDNFGNRVYIGHGTEHASDVLYSMLEDELGEGYIVGTIEGKKDLGDVLRELKSKGIKKTTLAPLMLVAGDHAVNDIAADEDSWKEAITKVGIEVEIDLTGLGEKPGVRELYLDRVRKLVSKKSNKLFVIGTGPGASDLLTIRAVEALKESDVVFVPVNKGKTMAYDTVSDFIRDKEIVEIEIPMKYVTHEDYMNAAALIEKHMTGKVASYITIGDAMTYSTAIYILQELARDIPVEVIPGIPSYIYAFDETIVPMTTKGENFLLMDKIDDSNKKILSSVNSVAILKAGMNPKDTIEALEEYGFKYKMVRRGSFESQEITDDRERIISNTDYMSLIIARKEED